MRGQLNLFSFQPKVKVFYPTSRSLNRKLWAIVHRTDDRGYSFGNFDGYYQKVKNYRCLTVILYQDRRSAYGAPKKKVFTKVIGFCTLSFEVDKKNNPVIRKEGRRTSWIDVWVLPRYRDLGFGSILVNKANEVSLQLLGRLPDGSDKHHTHCWDARFRENQKQQDEDDDDYYYGARDENQLPLLSENDREVMTSSVRKRITDFLSQNIGMDRLLTKFCLRQLER